MTKEEYTQLKAYLIGAYQNLVITDIVWYDILKEYDFKMMLRASKNYIKQSSFPPTIASLIKEHDKVVEEKLQFDNRYVLSVIDKAELNNLINYQEASELEFAWNYGEFTPEIREKLIKLSGDDPYMKKLLNERGDNETKLLA